MVGQIKVVGKIKVVVNKSGGGVNNCGGAMPPQPHSLHKYGILALPRQLCHDSFATTDSIIGMNANNCGEVNKRGGSNKRCG